MIRRSGHLQIFRDVTPDYLSLARGVVFARDAIATATLSSDPERTHHLNRTANEADGYSILWATRSGVHALHISAAGLTLEPVSFSLGDLVLVLEAGTPVSIDDAQNCYVVDPGKKTIHLEDAKTSTRTPILESIRIPAAGAEDAGQFSVAANLSSGAASSSIRYFYTSKSNKLAGFTYPAFQPNGSKIPVTINFDPAELGRVGSHLVFAATESGPSNFLTVDGQSLLLQTIPHQSGSVPQWDPVLGAVYQAPWGDWILTTGATGASAAAAPINLMCGLSGLEFAKTSANSILRFIPDSPAYAPNFLHPGTDGGTNALTSTCPGSDDPVQTSWVYIVPSATSGDAGYYSQPTGSGLFQTISKQDFLQVLQIRCAEFPVDAPPPLGATALRFPMVPYTGVSAATKDEATLYNQFEIELLSPTRCNAIFAVNWQSGPVGSAALSDGGFQVGPIGSLGLPLMGMTAPPAPSGPMAVTPQGLLSTFSKDHSVWEQLILATTGGGRQTIELRNLNEQLRAAMLTSQLFIVISDKDTFRNFCTVYFPGLNISGWTFDLALQDWRTDTVLILKFAEKSLRDLVNDTSLWSTAAGPLNNGIATQVILKAWIEEAEAKRGQPEFDYFLNTVLGDWNGILFANVKVPPSDFPPQLKALAAGIDIKRMKAHHLGVNLSPMQVKNGTIRVADSSLFGLIYYEDLQDLVYSSVPYDFKVLSLRVLFANSEISSFSSQIELLVGALFGQRSTLTGSLHGDNIILIGVMQKHGDEESYTFTEQGTNVFKIDSLVLDQVIITQSQFVTLPQATNSSATTARFLLSGSMRFLQNQSFDMLSFGSIDDKQDGPGGLQFSNLFVSMTYIPAGPTGSSGPSGPTGPSGPSGPTAQPEIRTFAFQAGQMNFDPSQSIARPESMYARFPLQVTGMVQGDSATTPASLGFIPVDTALVSKSFGSTWFGLQMSLSLGSQGGLASKAGFYANMLAAWAPDLREYNALLGIQLPGSQDGSKSLTIEGPLKLTIQDIAMLYNAKDKAYLMRFANIALSLFSLKFPPGGTTNLLLFGDPDPKATATTLGWYAAYQKNPSKSGPTGPASSRAALKSGRHKVIEGIKTVDSGCGCNDTKK